MFFADLLIFIIFQLLIVYPLGKTVLNFLQIKLWWVPNLVFSLIIGVVFFTLLVFGLGYTNNYRFLPLIIIVSPVLLLLQLKNISLTKFNFKGYFNRDNLVVILTISACILIQSAIVFPNGIRENGEIRLKDVFTQDAMWQVAMINNLQKNIPPENPIFAGEKLSNYHYFMVIFTATVQKFTNIEILSLYFKLIGPLLIFLFSTSLYFMLQIFTKNKLISAAGVLLVILSSTYYYIFGFLKPDLNLGPGSFFGNDYESRMVNYPLLFSYLIMTTFIYLLIFYRQKINSFRFLLFTGIFIGTSLGFKSYGAMLMIAALYLLGFLKIFKKEFHYLKIAILSTIFMLIIIFSLQNNKVAEPVFMFKPLWLIENMFSDPIRLNTSAWEIQRIWFFQHSNYLGLAYLYLKGLAIFLLANLGLKLLGFLSILRAREEREKEVILLFSIVVLLGIIIPLFFVQGGVKWNTIQFSYYTSVSLGILLVILLSYMRKKFGLNGVLIGILLIWASFLPGVFRYGKYYLSDEDNLTRYNFKGTQETFKAAKFLSTKEDGVLLLDSKYLQLPFVPAISGKNAYFADLTITSNLRIDGKERYEKVEKFFLNGSDESFRKSFLRGNNISYIFTAKNSLDSADYLTNIYTNSEVSIYKLLP